MDVQNQQAEAIQRPTTDDRDEWKDYLQAQRMPWRTEPEIGEERRQQLNKCRAFLREIPPLVKDSGVHVVDYDSNTDAMPSFSDIEPKLDRADVEWLLATQDYGRGPVDWEQVSNLSYAWRWGLDLRGANLRNVNLSGLPLNWLRAGLTEVEIGEMTAEQREFSVAHFEQANFCGATLKCAFLGYAYMDEVDLSNAHLEAAYMCGAHLQRARFDNAHAEAADFAEAQLQEADFSQASLQGAHFMDARAEKSSFWMARL